MRVSTLSAEKRLIDTFITQFILLAINIINSMTKQTYIQQDLNCSLESVYKLYQLSTLNVDNFEDFVYSFLGVCSLSSKD